MYKREEQSKKPSDNKSDSFEVSTNMNTIQRALSPDRKPRCSFHSQTIAPFFLVLVSLCASSLTFSVSKTITMRVLVPPSTPSPSKGFLLASSKENVKASSRTLMPFCDNKSAFPSTDDCGSTSRQNLFQNATTHYDSVLNCEDRYCSACQTFVYDYDVNHRAHDTANVWASKNNAGLKPFDPSSTSSKTLDPLLASQSFVEGSYCGACRKYVTVDEYDRKHSGHDHSKAIWSHFDVGSTKKEVGDDIDGASSKEVGNDPFGHVFQERPMKGCTRQELDAWKQRVDDVYGKMVSETKLRDI